MRGTNRQAGFGHNGCRAYLDFRVADQTLFEPLSAATILTALGAKARRFHVEVLDTCASTSTRLLDLAQAGAPSGTVVACERQTAGRGRRGRSWLSVPGDSLTFSLLRRFAAPAKPLAGLSLAVGVAVARALERLGADGIGLKWPNDILVADAKLGGILVETVAERGSQLAVIGIGLNVRLPRSLAEAIPAEAADLASAMPAVPSRNLLLAALLAELDAALGSFSRSGFPGCVDAWMARHAYAGRSVHILVEGVAPVAGRCIGVDGDGALLLETGAGVRRILSGEVSLRTA